MLTKIILEKGECILMSIDEKGDMTAQLFSVDEKSRAINPIRDAISIKASKVMSAIIANNMFRPKYDAESIDEYIEKICQMGHKVGITMKEDFVRYSLYDAETMAEILKTEHIERLKFGIKEEATDWNI